MGTRARARYDITARDRTAGAFRSFERRLRGAERVGAGLGRALGAVGAGAIGGGIFGGILTGAARSGDQLGKVAKRLGINVERLQELRFAAERTGVPFETLALGLQRMTRRVAEASKGQGEARDALKELGISASSLNRLPLERKFQRIADAFKAIKNPADRVRLAMKLFDSEGVGLVNTLDLGGRGIRDMGKEARGLGLIVESSAIDKLESLNDTFSDLTASLRILSLGLAALLSGPLSKTARGLGAFSANLGQSGNIGTAIAQGARAFMGKEPFTEKQFQEAARRTERGTSGLKLRIDDAVRDFFQRIVPGSNVEIFGESSNPNRKGIILLERIARGVEGGPRAG